MTKRNQGLAEEIQRTQPFEQIEEEVYLNLVRTVAQLSGPFRMLFQRFGLTEAQFNVLRILRGAPEKILSCESIGQRMVARSPDITQLIDRLERKSLVERQRSEKDRRVVYIRITTQGKKLLRQLDPKVQQLHSEQLSHMDPVKLTRLNELLVQARETTG